MSRTSSRYSHSRARAHPPARVSRRASRWILTARETPAFFRNEAGEIDCSWKGAAITLAAAIPLGTACWAIGYAIVCWAVPR